jgi:hypothetical protein
MPLANDITPSALRRLAGLRTEGQQVLSVYLDLDPSEFPTPEARASEITSLIDQARRQVEEADRPHAELMGLRAELERTEQFLREEDGYLSGARAVAVFASRPLDLFETLRLPSGVAREVVIASTPHLVPLHETGNAIDLCVALVDKRLARILRGSPPGLTELISFGDDVHGHHKAGGWSQKNYQRSVAKEVDDHLRHVVSVLEEEFRQQPFDRLLVASPPEAWGRFEELLPHDLRERLGGRLSLEVPEASIDDVNGASAQVIADEQREHEREVLARLEAALATRNRGVSGLSGTLEALVERRVEILIFDPGLDRPGAECPRCGWLSEAQTNCPVDGTQMTNRENIVDVAVARAIEQDAEVLAMRDQPALVRLGSIAAVLRF